MEKEALDKAIEIKREIETLQFFKERIIALMNGKSLKVTISISAQIENTQDDRKNGFFDYLDCRDGKIPEDLQSDIISAVDIKIRTLEFAIEKL